MSLIRKQFKEFEEYRHSFVVGLRWNFKAQLLFRKKNLTETFFLPSEYP